MSADNKLVNLLASKIVSTLCDDLAPFLALKLKESGEKDVETVLREALSEKLNGLNLAKPPASQPANNPAPQRASTPKSKAKSEHVCSAIRGSDSTQCANAGKEEFDGNWYCGVHIKKVKKGVTPNENAKPNVSSQSANVKAVESFDGFMDALSA